MIGNFEFNVDCAERGASCTAQVFEEYFEG